MSGFNLFAFDFIVECMSRGINVVQGFGGVTSVHLTLIEGQPQTVKMSTANLPAGASVVFSPSDIPFDREGGHYPYTSIATVKVITSSSTPTGTHTIKFVGTGGGITREYSLGLQVSSLTAKGKIYYVSLTGNDGNPGTSAQPFRTIQHGADISMPGDVIIVKAGEYKERIKIKTSGLQGSPITFLGEPGAIISGSEKITGWTPAPEIADGVYKKSLGAMPFSPAAIIWKGKTCAWIHSFNPASGLGTAWDLLKMGNSHLVSYPSAFAQNPWSLVGALGYAENGWAYVRLAGNLHPDNESVEFGSLEYTFDISAKNFITVSGFTIKNGYLQILLENKACGNIIEHNNILGMNSITVEDASDNLIRNNEMTMNFYYNDIGHPINATAEDYFIYMIFRKHVGAIEYGVNILETGFSTRNQIYENHIYYKHLGIRMGLQNSGTVRIFRNYIHHCCEYPLGQSTRDTLYLHDNLFYEGTHNWRCDAMPTTGVMYIYRNRFGLLTHKGTPGVYGSDGDVNAGSYLPEGRIYMYHNSFWDNSNFSISPAEGGVSNLFMVNNIFSMHWVFWEAGTKQYILHAGYNWYNDEGINGWMGANRNIYQPGIYMWDFVNPSFIPNPYTRTSGRDLSKTWDLDGIQHPALPGMTPGYFASNGPSMGAVQYEVSSIRENENAAGKNIGTSIQFLSSINQTKRSWTLRYSIPQPGNVQLAVFNHLGQCVRNLESADKPQGEYQIEWDQTDDKGRKLSNGIYFLLLKTSNQDAMHRILVVR